MEIKDHKIVGVPFKASPNIGGKLIPKYLIEHFDGSQNSTGAISWMIQKRGDGTDVSAHIHIDREGKITQLVAFDRVAWHAGVSEWRGVSGLNSQAIGIEIQNTGSQEYTQVQMDSVIEVSKLLVQVYGLREIIGHEDVSPIRKNDPSGTKVNLFDWVSVLRGCCFDLPKKIASSDLNVRRGQGTQYPVVALVPKGGEVYELNRVGSWSKIQFKGSKQAGWVSNAYLK